MSDFICTNVYAMNDGLTNRFIEELLILTNVKLLWDFICTRIWAVGLEFMPGQRNKNGYALTDMLIQVGLQHQLFPGGHSLKL